MARTMKLTAVLLCLLTALFAWWYLRRGGSAQLTLAITFATVAYHFCIRLLIGGIYSAVMQNRADYTRRWFQPGRGELALYERLHVKRWKAHIPTFVPDLFDPRLHTWDEIAQAMCQAELVHETIILFSFLPILAAVWCGALPVFVITSLLAACLDGVFVVVQRYNRPRILRLAERQKRLGA